MHFSVTRRIVALGLGLALLPAHAAPRSSTLKIWLLGDWQSDRERTMENFHFQGHSLTAAQREKTSQMFGHLRYHVTSSHFQVVEGRRKLRVPYRVASETESSITLRFARTSDIPELTLYRVGSDSLFIKSGKHLEYFRRNAA